MAVPDEGLAHAASFNNRNQEQHLPSIPPGVAECTMKDDAVQGHRLCGRASVGDKTDSCPSPISPLSFSCNLFFLLVQIVECSLESGRPRRLGCDSEMSHRGVDTSERGRERLALQPCRCLPLRSGNIGSPNYPPTLPPSGSPLNKLQG